MLSMTWGKQLQCICYFSEELGLCELVRTKWVDVAIGYLLVGNLKETMLLNLYSLVLYHVGLYHVVSDK